MARTAAIQGQAPDPTAINLTRILDHLERALLSPDGDPQLRRSSFERTKVGTVCRQPFTPSPGLNPHNWDHCSHVGGFRI